MKIYKNINTLKEDIVEKIKNDGEIVYIKDDTLKEILNYSFRVKLDNFSMTEKQKSYYCEVKKKIQPQINRIKRLLQDEPYSRQLVILFDKLDCFLVFQIQFREGKAVITVYQRSMSIEKFENDIKFMHKLTQEICDLVFIEYIQFYIGNLHKYL